MKQQMERFNLWLPVDLIRRLEAQKKETGAPVSEQIRRAIEAYLKQR
jgi:predicted DNA-binding protein